MDLTRSRQLMMTTLSLRCVCLSVCVCVRALPYTSSCLMLERNMYMCIYHTVCLQSKAKGFGPMPAFGKGLFNDDELNLAGLLNVLDGVVDTPNRIVIM